MKIGEMDKVVWDLGVACKIDSAEISQPQTPPSPADHQDALLTNGTVENGPLVNGVVENGPLEPSSKLGSQPDDASQNDLESFSRFRSRSEGSVLGLPRKGLLKKPTEADALKLCRRVSFADSNGHQLEQVLSFDVPSTDTDDDEPAFLLPTCTPSAIRARPSGERRFVPYFTLPWSAPGRHSMVYAALEDRKVCLETFTINSSWRISGTILVKNMSFDKHVFARRTLDKWQTYKDVDATYVCSVNENVDRFRFELHFAFKLPPGTRLEVALGYHVPKTGGHYWDNNGDNNYAFWFNDKI